MGTIPLTPTGILWAGIITPRLDPVVEGMLPEEYGFAWDMSKFATTIGGDYLFADLLSKFMFHEQYALTLSQEIRLRMWARTWIRAGQMVVAGAPLLTAAGVGLTLGIIAAEAGGFEKMINITPSGKPSIVQGVFNRWTRNL